MPTFSIDITDKYLNLFEEFKKDDGIRNPLNPGQIWALENIDLSAKAIADVEISGTNIIIKVNWTARYEYRDYISETVDILQETFELYSQQISSLRGSDSEGLIDEAFASL